MAEANVVYDTIESGVSEVRKFGCECVNAVKSKKKPIDDFVSTGIEHSQCEFTVQLIQNKIENQKNNH